MKSFKLLELVFHPIKAMLYPNYLTQMGGKFVARAVTYAPLDVREVCNAAIQRGGSSRRLEDMVGAVSEYLDEAAYQLVDGYTVKTDYFSIRPYIKGTFDKSDDKFDSGKHNLEFGFRTKPLMRGLAENAKVEIKGLAGTSGFITRVFDVASETEDEALTPGGVLSVSGHKLRMIGDKPEVGVFLVNTANQSRVAVTEFIKNRPTELIFFIPSTLTAGSYCLEIVTQFTSGSNILLKEPRTIRYEVALETAGSGNGGNGDGGGTEGL
jgi:hypothetical protein